FFTPKPDDNKDIEKPISKLAQFRGGDSYLVSYTNENKKTYTEGIKDAVYFVKKEARYQYEIYYLLSTKRITIEGIIDMMEIKHLVIHDHILVDHDKKEFILNGKCKACSVPWGCKTQIVINNLMPYKDKSYTCRSTEYVGNNLWYQLEIDNEHVWLNYKFVK